MPAKKRKQPDEKYPLKLTVKQRESLVHATRLAMGLKTRIKAASKDQQFVEFTKQELEKMGEETWAGRIAICTSSLSGGNTTDPSITKIGNGRWEKGTRRGFRPARSPRGDGRSGSFTSMTSGTPGSTRSSLRKSWNQSRMLRTPVASKGQEHAHRRMWEASREMASAW